MTNYRTALAAAALHHALLGSIALCVALLPSEQAAAEEASFTPVGTFGAYRLDGVRDGMHEGARVRFVDMTLHNRSNQTTFPETIQAIWWQGRNSGGKIDARFRDLTPFGMYDFVKPGQVIEVTYIMPVRADIDGIRADYMKAPKGQQERRWTWAELIARGPGTIYHKGRPVGASTTVVSAANPIAPSAQPAATSEGPAASAAPAKEPDLGQVKDAVDTLTNGRTSLPTKQRLKGLLGSKLKTLPF
jgi:hypothetical protein